MNYEKLQFKTPLIVGVLVLIEPNHSKTTRRLLTIIPPSCLYKYSTVIHEFPSTWYFLRGTPPPSSTASEAVLVPYPEKRYEAKNRGIISTQEWKREWNFLPN
jgi:hypothetical protein